MLSIAANAQGVFLTADQGFVQLEPAEAVFLHGVILLADAGAAAFRVERAGLRASYMPSLAGRPALMSVGRAFYDGRDPMVIAFAGPDIATLRDQLRPKAALAKSMQEAG